MPTKDDISLPIASNTYSNKLFGKYSLQAKNILLKPGKIKIKYFKRNILMPHNWFKYENKNKKLKMYFFV